MKKFDEFLSETLAHEVKSEPKTAAAKQAKQLGLTYMGFGRYADKKGKLAYYVDNDRLLPYKNEDDILDMRDEVEDIKLFPSPKAKSKDGKPVKIDKDQQKKDEYKTYSKLLSRRNKEDLQILNKKKKEARATHKALYNFYNPNMFEDDEREALTWYSEDGYEDINKFLYQGHEPGATHDQDWYLKTAIKAIDSAFEGMNAPFDYSSYMGLSARYKPNKLKTGQEYIFRGYLSTSLDFGTAIDGFTDEDNKTPVVFQIDIKKGQKSIYIDPLLSNSGENETMLPRGSRIKIISGPHLLDDDVVSDNPSQTPVHLFHCEIIEDK